MALFLGNGSGGGGGGYWDGVNFLAIAIQDNPEYLQLLQKLQRAEARIRVLEAENVRLGNQNQLLNMEVGRLTHVLNGQNDQNTAISALLALGGAGGAGASSPSSSAGPSRGPPRPRNLNTPRMMDLFQKIRSLPTDRVNYSIFEGLDTYPHSFWQNVRANPSWDFETAKKHVIMGYSKAIETGNLLLVAAGERPV